MATPCFQHVDCPGSDNPYLNFNTQAPDLGVAFGCGESPAPELNTTSCIVFGNYLGGEPNFTPDAGVGAAFDVDTARPWFFFNGAWN